MKAKGPQNKKRVVAIVQARMGSSRLPGKSLMMLAGSTLIEHVVRRALASRLVDSVVVAVPDTSENDVLADYVLHHLNLDVCRGSDEDVLSRFASVVQKHEPDVVVRITADDPLKDPALMDLAIDLLLRNPEVVYVSNSLEPTYPEGLDVEVVRAWALLEANSEAILQSDREHVTPFIWRQPERYPQHHFTSPRNLGSWRWTLDTQADFTFLSAVLDLLSTMPKSFEYEKVVELIESSPALMDLMPKAPRSVDKLI